MAPSLVIKNELTPNFEIQNLCNQNYSTLSFENIRFDDFEKLKSFFSSVCFSQVNSLSFINTNIADDFLIEIISKNFQNLCYLELSLSFKITEKFLIWFFLSSFSKKLVTIKLQSLLIKNDGIYALCFSNFAKIIREIDLGLCINLNEIAFLNIAMSENLANIEKLNLGYTKLTCRCLEALAISPYFSNLKELRLNYTGEVKNQGFKILLSSRNWKYLELMEISSSPIENGSFELLGEVTTYPKLQALIFIENSLIEKKSFLTFLNSSIAKQLKYLDFSMNDIDDEILASIAKNREYHSLSTLKLNHCKKITSDGIIKLLKSDNLPNLKNLSLADTGVDDQLIEFLNKFESKLQSLDLRGCKKILGPILDKEKYI